VVHCLRCGYGKGVKFSTFLKVIGVSKNSATLFVPPLPSKPKKDSIGLPEGHVPFGRLEGDPVHDSMREYLFGRGLSNEDILSYQLGYCYSWPYENRIIIPIIDDGEVVFWGARATFPATRKVLYPNYVKKGNHVFGLNLAQQFRVVVICEAYLDAITTGLNAVGIGGTSLSEVQLFKLLPHKFECYVIALDGDAPAYLSQKIAHQIGTCTSAAVRILKLPEEHDPNSIGREQMQERVRQLITSYNISRLRP
jgi:DNA primase